METIQNDTYRDQFKPDRYVFASNPIGFGTDPIYFEVPASRFASIPYRLGRTRMRIEWPTHRLGSFRYHLKSLRYRNDPRQLPLGSTDYGDIRFFDIALSRRDIALSHSDIGSSRRQFVPSLRRFTSFWRRLFSDRSDIAPCRTDVSRSRTRLSLRRSDVGPAPRKPSTRCRRVPLSNPQPHHEPFPPIRRCTMMTQKVIVLTGFAKLSDAQALATAGAVFKGVYVDKVIAAPPPLEPATFETAVDDLTGAIAAQAQAGGGTAVTAVKTKKTERTQWSAARPATPLSPTSWTTSADLLVKHRRFLARLFSIRTNSTRLTFSRTPGCRRLPSA